MARTPPHQASAHSFHSPSGASRGAEGTQLRRPENVVAHFGVGRSAVLLTQVQPQLALVPEMQAAGVALWEERPVSPQPPTNTFATRSLLAFTPF